MQDVELSEQTGSPVRLQTLKDWLQRGISPSKPESPYKLPNQLGTDIQIPKPVEDAAHTGHHDECAFSCVCIHNTYTAHTYMC